MTDTTASPSPRRRRHRGQRPRRRPHRRGPRRAGRDRAGRRAPRRHRARPRRRRGARRRLLRPRPRRRRSCRAPTPSSPPCTRWAPTWRPSTASPSRAPRSWPGPPATPASTRLVHVSTAAVYDRSPEAGDVDESSRAGGRRTATTTPYQAATPTSRSPRSTASPRCCCAPRPSSARARPRSGTRCARAGPRRRVRAAAPSPTQTFPWVHVDDLAPVAADLATGRIPSGSDPATGPVEGGCTPLNVTGEPATPARLPRHRHRRPRRRAGVGGRPGLDRPLLRRPGPRAGAGPRRSG